MIQRVESLSIIECRFFGWSNVESFSIIECRMSFSIIEYLRFENDAHGDTQLWREAAEGGHSCHEEPLQPAMAFVLGPAFAPALSDREGLCKGAAQGTLASLVNLTPSNFLSVFGLFGCFGF